MGEILCAEHITKIYPGEGGGFRALSDVSLSVPENGLTILKGRSGSGKTTLLNILSALDKPTEGSVVIAGENITALSEGECTGLRRTKFGFVFQSVALIQVMTAFENVELSLRMAGIRENRKERALECLSLVGLRERADHLPQEMSGGEQQRTAIARAIAHRPQIIFADEPTGALDTASGLQVIKLFRELVEKEGVSIVMTTHDVGLMEYGDAVYELEGGELVHGE